MSISSDSNSSDDHDSQSQATDPTKVVHPGACYLRNELVQCAMDQSHCADGLEFRSARDMQDSDDPLADRCKGPHYTLGGMCTSPKDTLQCTGDASACRVPSKFVPDMPYCSVQYNHFPQSETHLSLYPRCSSSDFGDTCVYSSDDCGVEEAFTTASLSMVLVPGERIPDLCTCDQVRTGACFHPEQGGAEWTCAVSADACDADSIFRDWKEVLQEGKDCRLCPDFDKNESPTASTASHLHWGHGRGHGLDHHHRPADIAASSDLFRETPSCQAGIVVGTVVGGSVVALLATLVIHFAYSRKLGAGKAPIEIEKGGMDEGKIRKGTMA